MRMDNHKGQSEMSLIDVTKTNLQLLGFTEAQKVTSKNTSDQMDIFYFLLSKCLSSAKFKRKMRLCWPATNASQKEQFRSVIVSVYGSMVEREFCDANIIDQKMMRNIHGKKLYDIFFLLSCYALELRTKSGLSFKKPDNGLCVFSQHVFKAKAKLSVGELKKKLSIHSLFSKNMSRHTDKINETLNIIASTQRDYQESMREIPYNTVRMGKQCDLELSEQGITELHKALDVHGVYSSYDDLLLKEDPIEAMTRGLAVLKKAQTGITDDRLSKFGIMVNNMRIQSTEPLTLTKIMSILPSSSHQSPILKHKSHILTQNKAHRTDSIRQISGLSAFSPKIPKMEISPIGHRTPISKREPSIIQEDFPKKQLFDDTSSYTPSEVRSPYHSKSQRLIEESQALMARIGAKFVGAKEATDTEYVEL
ncbi:hypothetical protein PCE1_004938 [Barthelona sp. PCE]